MTSLDTLTVSIGLDTIVMTAQLDELIAALQAFRDRVVKINEIGLPDWQKEAAPEIAEQRLEIIRGMFESQEGRPMQVPHP